MTLSQILVLVADMLDDGELKSALISQDTPSASDAQKISLLISCANQVSSIIATEYLHIYKTKSVSTTTGIINFSDIDLNGVIDIVYIRSCGVDMSFEVVDGEVHIAPGNYKIKYISQPQTLSIESVVSDFPKLSPRIFAYGVAAEYLFIKGNIDDAESWNKRFEDGILGVLRLKPSRIMPVRRWY